MKVRLDLHTHILEATRFQPPSPQVAREVIARARAADIDGIAVTEHRNKEYGFAFKELVEQEFPGQLLVIPGWEIEVSFGPAKNDEYQVAELFLDGGRVFRCYCHPGYPSPEIVIDGVQAIEVDNLGHNWHINKERVKALAEEHGLLLLKVSDAHRLEDLGRNYTEVDLDDLYARAIPLNGAHP